MGLEEKHWGLENSKAKSYKSIFLLHQRNRFAVVAQPNGGMRAGSTTTNYDDVALNSVGLGA